jgi:hypothetical protein
MAKPKMVAQVNVVKDDQGVIFIVTPCGCAWRLSGTLTHEVDLGQCLAVALGHMEEGTPCFVVPEIIRVDVGV